MMKSHKGVTLIELLAVIVILGVIASIAIPALGSLITNTQKKAVLADAIQVKNAVNVCIIAGDCHIPSINESPNIFGDDGVIGEYIMLNDGNYKVSIASTGVILVAIVKNPDNPLTAIGGEWYFSGNPSSETVNTDNLMSSVDNEWVTQFTTEGLFPKSTPYPVRPTRPGL
ncbi:MAG: prepilin-type N-terminal cleavage/methylation domain-containing protein [Acholeplasmataceae bacterium]|nr:prepilin-type N-terminal cleavage/methylation domain-containing protein [Acholeplasmataceae bacterium]